MCAAHQIGTIATIAATARLLEMAVCVRTSCTTGPLSAVRLLTRAESWSQGGSATQASPTTTAAGWAPVLLTDLNVCVLMLSTGSLRIDASHTHHL
jgi:hypothetical protein